MILREYQQDGFSRIQGEFRDRKRAPLYVLPTGGGKTVLFVAIAQSAMQRGKRVLILVHRQELLDQVSATLTQFEIPHGVVAAGYSADVRHPVQVASVMSLARRLDRTPAPDLIIIDEAHHAVSDSWMRVIRHFSSAKLLGVTATPTRTNGQGLGDIFDCLILGPSVAELTAAGYLAPARVFAPPTINTDGLHTLMGDFVPGEAEDRANKPKVTGDAIAHYQRLAPGKRAAVFCCSLKHAADIAEAARQAGISALMIDGGMDRDVRRRVVSDFQRGLIQWLVSAEILSEGFDCPGIEVGIFLRPTQSLTLDIQQKGRCLRTAPGKEFATLIDHAGNTLRHGLPDDERQWTLDGTPKTKGSKPKEKPAMSRVCLHCHAANHVWRTGCRDCGQPFEVKGRSVREEDGELVEVKRIDVDAAANARVGDRKIGPEIWKAAAAGDVNKLHAIAKERGYKPGVVTHWMRIAGRRHLAKVMRG